MSKHLEVAFANPLFKGKPGTPFLDANGQPRYLWQQACAPPAEHDGIALVTQPDGRRLKCTRCKELWVLFDTDNDRFLQELCP